MEYLWRREYGRKENHFELKEYCDKKEIEFLSTAFYEEGADILEELKVNAIKIDSANLNNYPFLKRYTNQMA